jgi:dTDP-4-dehydrorhamnose 3,5-epimerase
MRHVSVRLSDDSRDAVYIPAGFAHGFQTLVDDVEVQYHMTDEFRPEVAGGFRWDDPAFSITLPLEVAAIAARDAGYADFDRVAYTQEFAARSRVA